MADAMRGFVQLYRQIWDGDGSLPFWVPVSRVVAFSDRGDGFVDVTCDPESVNGFFKGTVEELAAKIRGVDAATAEVQALLAEVARLNAEMARLIDDVRNYGGK